MALADPLICRSRERDTPLRALFGRAHPLQ
jgi:hypothetical protein